MSQKKMTMKWISVEEQLPEKKGYCLCWWYGDNHPDGMMDVLNFDGTEFPWETVFPFQHNKVTHWMPLPGPPMKHEDTGEVIDITEQREAVAKSIAADDFDEDYDEEDARLDQELFDAIYKGAHLPPGMTYEEAIQELKKDKALYETETCYAGDGTPDGTLILALDMAIKVLEDKRQELETEIDNIKIADQNYWNAIKATIDSGKADKILISDKAKRLSTPVLTPTEEIPPEWTEYLEQQKE